MADPLFANVKVLLNCNGVNGSAVLTDSSSSARSFTAAGNAQISTAQSRFGGASLLLDGEGDYFTSAASTDFAFPDDFALEFWARKTADGPGGFDHVMTTDASNGSAIDGWFCELSSSRGFVFATNGSVVASFLLDPNDGLWHHWAVTRAGDTLRLFKDGELLQSLVYTAPIPAVGEFGVGGSSNSLSYCFAGNLDEIRVTKGAARYTGTFTPPDAPFDGEAVTTYVLSGNVKDAAGANVARDVAIFRRSPLTHLATVTSSGSTGNYSYTTAFNELHVLVALPASGEALNALVLDRVTPKAVTT